MNNATKVNKLKTTLKISGDNVSINNNVNDINNDNTIKQNIKPLSHNNIPPYINKICKLALGVYTKLYDNKIVNTKECNFQNLFYKELMKAGNIVNCEVVRPILYSDGYVTKQFSDGCFYREDMVIDEKCLVIENKRIKFITDKEEVQLYKYIYQRSKYTDWGNNTTGLLINFGDNLFEVKYLFYNQHGIISSVTLINEKFKHIYDDICQYELK